jgi:superfamily II DNA or RNA helicase
MISLATGAGKTVIAAEAMRRLQEHHHWRCLFLVHREELLLQTLDKLSAVWPECDVGAVQAWRNDANAEQVLVGSVQTLVRPNRRQQIGTVDMIVTDEAHHARALSYRQVYAALRPKFHLGITATPKRSDGMGLNKVFDEIIYHIGTLELIARGYLCDVRYRRIKTNTSLRSVRMFGADFHPQSLDTVINVENRNDLIVESYLSHGEDRTMLAFCSSLPHAHTLVKLFLDRGVPAEVITGDTPSEERQARYLRLRRGETKVLCNFNVLTEGFDEPSVGGILMCRPTKSDLLYTQIIGRCLRTFPGKPDALVLDFTDDMHDLCSLPTLLGLPEVMSHLPTDQPREVKTLRETLLETEELQQKLLGRNGFGTVAQPGDPFARSALTWTERADRMVLELPKQGRVVIEPHPNRPGAFQIMHIPPGQQHGTALTLRPVPQDYAVAVAEAKAQEILKGHTQIIQKDAPWLREPISPGQVAFIQRISGNRVRIPANATKGWGKTTIDALKNHTYWDRFKKGKA